MKTPLKWMGGKTKLIPFIEEFIPPHNKYIEPFLGSGAIFYSQQPENALLSDKQKEPILIMESIKNSPEAFYAAFVMYSERLWEEGSDYYYEMRKRYNEGDFIGVNKAAAFMLLLRAGFNGLVRFNPKGEWNVPFGDRGYKNSKAQAWKLYNATPYEYIMEVSIFLNEGEKQFIQQSFDKSIQQAGEGDFIYADPPYLITTQQYNGWGQADELLLAKELKFAGERGAKFILSNVYTYKGGKNDALLELYKDFDYKLKPYKYVVGPNRQRNVEEIIIFN